jgi:hypothetical protein
MLKILEKIHAGPEMQYDPDPNSEAIGKVRSGYEKNNFGSTTLASSIDYYFDSKW